MSRLVYKIHDIVRIERWPCERDPLKLCGRVGYILETDAGGTYCLVQPLSRDGKERGGLIWMHSSYLVREEGVEWMMARVSHLSRKRSERAIASMKQIAPAFVPAVNELREFCDHVYQALSLGGSFEMILTAFTLPVIVDALQQAL